MAITNMMSTIKYFKQTPRVREKMFIKTLKKKCGSIKGTLKPLERFLGEYP